MATNVTSRSRFSVLFTTNPKHMGYDSTPAPSDKELYDVHGPDFVGSIGQCVAWLDRLASQMGGTYYRVVIRRASDGEFVRRVDVDCAWSDIVCAQ